MCSGAIISNHLDSLRAQVSSGFLTLLWPSYRGGKTSFFKRSVIGIKNDTGAFSTSFATSIIFPIYTPYPPPPRSPPKFCISTVFKFSRWMIVRTFPGEIKNNTYSLGIRPSPFHPASAGGIGFLFPSLLQMHDGPCFPIPIYGTHK